MKKAIFALIASFILLLPPLFNLLKSLDFTKKAVRVKARIVKYNPQIIGKAGGRREIKGLYLIEFEGNRKEVQFGSRMVTSKEKILPPDKGSPFKEGDTISIAYVQTNPEKLIIKPGKNLLRQTYHSHESIALFYLLKIISLVLLVVTIHSFRKSLRK